MSRRAAQFSATEIGDDDSGGSVGSGVRARARDQMRLEALRARSLLMSRDKQEKLGQEVTVRR